jgi:hypothetical protein
MSIISINGKISSGKDTVGRIIQYLTSKYKDKYDFIEWRDRVENYGSNTYSPFEIKKYAGKLKTIASLLTGVPVEMFEDQEFKKLDMNPEWGMTYREFLQRLGTEAMRDGLHTNVWVNALFADYKEEIYRTPVPTRAAGFIDQYVYPNWIITDMRFPNEMEAVEKRKGITIRVVRNQIKTGNLILEHASETALNNAKFDYEIINDGSIEDLVEKVREILIKENII